MFVGGKGTDLFPENMSVFIARFPLHADLLLEALFVVIGDEPLVNHMFGNLGNVLNT